MKYGEILQGTITDLDEKGRGMFLFRLPSGDERRVVVPFTTPGDVIDASFVKRDKGTWVGRLVRVHTASSARTETPCPHAGVCGGCLWQHLQCEAQIQLKQQALVRAYAAAGITQAAAPVAPSPQAFGYRNRRDYVVSWKGDVGLKEYGSWNHYLDLSTCLLLDETTPHILKAARELLQTLAWEPWDARKHTGQLRYVVIRLGRNTGQRLIMLVVHDLARISEEERAIIRRTFGSLCTSLVLGENAKPTDLSYVERCEVLQGSLQLEEEVNGIHYQIHPNAFFQTNTIMAAELQNRVLHALGEIRNKRVLDLYGGIGFFGIACAKQGAEVVGQELDTFAVEEAKKNAHLNAVHDRCSFASGPVEALPAATWKADAAIIDPPRAGLHPKALQALIEHGPQRVVYVSCNYHSFLREWPLLAKAYTLDAIEPLDLFPQTPHVEVIHTLTRRTQS